MSADKPLWSPTVWLNSAHVERWLRELWPSWRIGDVRHEWDADDRWYWVIRDYDRGRSRVLGITRPLLEQTTLTTIRSVLEGADWLTRIDDEALLISRSGRGNWSVEAWMPKLDEKWFPDPGDGFFVAFRDSGGAVSSAPGPARLPSPFLALHGKTWSALGPANPRPVDTYSLDELLPHVPRSHTSAP